MSIIFHEILSVLDEKTRTEYIHQLKLNRSHLTLCMRHNSCIGLKFSFIDLSGAVIDDHTQLDNITVSNTVSKFLKTIISPEHVPYFKKVLTEEQFRTCIEVIG